MWQTFNQQKNYYFPTKCNKNVEQHFTHTIEWEKIYIFQKSLYSMTYIGLYMGWHFGTYTFLYSVDKLKFFIINYF